MATALNHEDGTRIAFEDVGDGPAVLLAHGSGLSRAAWRGTGYIRALRESHRVIAVDLRGHGRSDKPHDSASYRMPLVVGDILAVLDATGVDAAHYVGYSFGARVGFSLIDSHPERVNRFVCAAGTWRATSGAVSELFFRDWESALMGGGMSRFLSQWEARSGRPIDASTTAAFLANDPVALAAYFRQAEQEPGIPERRLAFLQTPTLLLAGSRDSGRAEDSLRAAELMPNATFVELAGRDHATTMIPSGEVLDLILPFLA